MSRKSKCSGEALPVMRLVVEKKHCARVDGEAISTPASVAAFVNKHYGCAAQEVFLALHLNSANQVISVQEVGLGGVGQTAVDPKTLFGGALTSGAAAMIVVHNHPSGNPEPGREDIALTRVLVDGATLLSLRVLDHIVVGRGGQYTSFVERGIMPQPRVPAFSGLGDEAPEYQVFPRRPR
jgi:DNA repair protein RadC